MAAILDTAMAPMDPLRPRLVEGARGEVLELGVGTGANLQHYLPEQVDSVVGVEPDPHMLRRARARAETAPVPVHLRQWSAEALPVDDASFDTVVATWVFCTIPDAAMAAREAFRVLRPGGRLLFVEHVGAEHVPSRTAQSLLDPMWQRCAGGCHLTRDPVALLERAGFALDGVRPWGRQRWALAPMIRGDAIKRQSTQAPRSP